MHSPCYYFYPYLKMVKCDIVDEWIKCHKNREVTYFSNAA